MTETKIFRVKTFHGTLLCVDAGLKISHASNAENVRLIYARQDSNGVVFFVSEGNEIRYVESLDDGLAVKLSSEPQSITIPNGDGSISIKLGDNFLSARKDGSFSRMPHNKEWEQLTLVPTDLLNLIDDNVFVVRTFHGTKLFLDVALNVRHKAELEPNELPIYAQSNDNRISFFVFKDGALKYLDAIDDKGGTVLSDTPIEFNLANNIVDGSLAIEQNGQFWSARKDTGAIILVSRNREWEHITLEKINTLALDKQRVILVVLEPQALDAALARLNGDRLDLRAVLIDGEVDEAKKLPATPFDQSEKVLNSERESLWLLAGGSIDERRNASKYLQSRGLPRERIVDLERKMRVTPNFLSKVNAALESEFDFMATGERLASVELNRLVGSKRLNLAAEGQDLYQSYLIAKHVFERNHSIKFALIELTAESLSPDAEDCFSARECGYLFDAAPRSIEMKIFSRLLNHEITLPTEETSTEESNPAPLPPSKKIFALETRKPATISARKLQLLEDFIQLCIGHGVKPIGVMLPLNEPNDERLKVLRYFARNLERIYDFASIDLTFLTPDNSMTTVSKVLYTYLCLKDVISAAEMRSLSYEQIKGLKLFLSHDEYNELLDRIFAASADVIGRKDKIKLGFVLHDAAMWCGDELYNHFAQNDRYDVTVFSCMRTNLDKLLTIESFKKSTEVFRSRGINVVAVINSKLKIPKQDVLIYLNPYFYNFPRQFKPAAITAETLIAYIPYTIGIGIWGRHAFKMYDICWTLFSTRKNQFERITENKQMSESRMVLSGQPKMDIFFKREDIRFDWKTVRPDAKKIIWAPHWSIRGFGSVHQLATFQWNYQFFYEYAKAHPETSWVVKPHPTLFKEVLDCGVFKSSEEFKEYLDAWDALPNAQVVTGGYYQSIFVTSDAMILDSSSFTVEYQFTHKPLLFLTRTTTKLNPIGKMVIDANYHIDGKDHEGIAKFIEDVVINGNDTQREAREKVFDEELNYVKDNGMLASEKIFETIDQAFKR